MFLFKMCCGFDTHGVDVRCEVHEVQASFLKGNGLGGD